MYNFAFLLIFRFYCLFGNTIFSTPLIALGYEMTSDYKERTKLMGFANSVGQLLDDCSFLCFNSIKIYYSKLKGVKL